MGGRGSSSGTGGGGGAYGGFATLQGLIGAMKASQANGGTTPNSSAYSFHQGEGNTTPDYTNHDNPETMKWQGQTDEDKAASYLAKLGKQQTPPQDAEGYDYHQSPFQNMVIAQDINAPVYAKLSASDFDKYCKANNLTPIYRGWKGGSQSKMRFEDAAASHTGTGMYGEGYYFGDKSTASGYSGGALSTAALSPAARVVDVGTVRAAIYASGDKLSKAFGKSGHTGSHYSDNIGEAQMALKMGYNVIRTDWCYCVLTREAVVIRK